MDTLTDQEKNILEVMIKTAINNGIKAIDNRYETEVFDVCYSMDDVSEIANKLGLRHLKDLTEDDEDEYCDIDEEEVNERLEILTGIRGQNVYEY